MDSAKRDRKQSERDHKRIRRAGIARERFGMDLLLDVGEWAVSLDPHVAEILRHGIHEDSPSVLADILHSRRKRARERGRGASFETSLGLGCVFYSDLDESE